MPTNYPNSIDSLTNDFMDGDDAGDETPGSTEIGPHSAHHNDLADAVVAIEEELGTNPSGDGEDVAEKIDNLEGAIESGLENTLTAAQDYADGPATVSSDKTTDYTLILTDAGTVVVVNSASARQVTVPNNTTVAYPIGTVIRLLRRGAGTLTVVAAGGVTLRTPFTAEISTQYGSAELLKIATNEWIVTCD
jgi:hypothetical protein